MGMVVMEELDSFHWSILNPCGKEQAEKRKCQEVSSDRWATSWPSESARRDSKTDQRDSRKGSADVRWSGADFAEHRCTSNLGILRPGRITCSLHYSDSSETSDMLPHYGARGTTERSFCFLWRTRPGTLNWTASGSGSIQLSSANHRAR